jgi:glucose-6-phosphate 1-dehydrogenase
MRSDQVDAAWQIINPILNAWQKTKALEFPNYAPGSNVRSRQMNYLQNMVILG